MQETADVVAIVYGCNTPEHYLSVEVGQGLLHSLVRLGRKVVPLFRTPNGQWYSCRDIRKRALVSDARPELVPVELVSANSANGLLMRWGQFETRICYAVLCSFGGEAEDGSLQGFFDLAGVPHSGPSAAAASLLQNKITAKLAFRQVGLPTPDFLVIPIGPGSSDWTDRNAGTLASISYPAVVKPARSGSSLGITVVSDRFGMADAISAAARYDTLILVEDLVLGDEYRVAALGPEPLTISLPGKLSLGAGIASTSMSFNNTYSISVDRDPAPWYGHFREAITRLYQSFEISGLVRVDLLVSNAHPLGYYVLEADAIPTFGPENVSTKLLQATGISYETMISRIVDLGHIGRARRNFYRNVSHARESGQTA